MRRRVMTAFMCAIMTMSVIPVNADDTQVAKAQQEMESTVKTETTEMSTQSTTKTEKKKTSRKKKTKITKKKISKDKNGKKSDNEEKVVPMPTQVISKSSTQAMERRISSKQAKIAKLRKEKAKIFKQMKLEAQKEETLKTFYEKYTANSKAEIALFGQEITPAMKISKKDEAMRDDLYELADLFGDKQLKTIAGKYVFGINHPDFETLLDKNDNFNLNQYLKNEKILPVKPMQQKIATINKKIKQLKKDISKENQTRYFNPNNVSLLSHITVDDAKQMLKGTALYADAKAYVKAEEKYHVNAVFLMGIAAHESAWGTSELAKNKNNLFGYGAYDSNPYNGAYTFSNYSESIDLIARVLVKYYINPKGTKIYGDEKAAGTYYNGPTLSGINTKYATDKNWANAVYNHMKYLYEKL